MWYNCNAMMERRKHTRYEADYPVELNGGTGSGHHLAVVDVSKGGIAFNSHKELTLSDKVNVKLYLKNRMFSLYATIARSEKKKEGMYNVGAMFLEPPLDFLEALEKEIQEITQLHRERNLYKRIDTTFRKASREYLGL